MAEHDGCSVIAYEPRYAADFRRLNEEWLERYFAIEPVDARVLGDPQRHILDPGGHILFVRCGSEIVGTCALKPDANGRIELTKMAVSASAQGRGLGRQLLEAAIAWFVQQSATLLFLESHSSLEAALALYLRHGFVLLPRPFESDYARSDVYMEWRGNQAITFVS